MQILTITTYNKHNQESKKELVFQTKAQADQYVRRRKWNGGWICGAKIETVESKNG